MFFLLNSQYTGEGVYCLIENAMQVAEETAPIIVKTITDWNMFWGSVGVGLLSVAATVIAVVWTNRKNAERFEIANKEIADRYEADVQIAAKRYEELNRLTAERYDKDKERQDKANAMAIIKPSIKSGSIGNIVEELILTNVRDRVLLLSSDKDGFDFYDDEDKMFSFNHRLFSIRNDSKNNIRLVKIEVYSKISTDSHAIIEDKVINYVKLFRSNEEILIRMCSTEQRDKLWEQLDKNKMVELFFDCKINYLTFANDQICYEYQTIIKNTPKKCIIDGNEHTRNSIKTDSIKDEYNILSDISLDEGVTSSHFRNLQDFIQIDRIKFAHRRMGEAQAQGLMAGLGHMFPNTTTQNTDEAGGDIKNEA